MGQNASAPHPPCGREKWTLGEPRIEENLEKTLLFGLSGAPAVQGAFEACQGAPKDLPRASSKPSFALQVGLLGPSRSRISALLVLRPPKPGKACPRPPEELGDLPRSSPEPGMACPRPPKVR